MPRKQPDLATLRRDEHGAIHKRPRGRLRVALAYPNSYHVAMSCLGFQTVYRLFNQHDDVVCERVFLPPEDLNAAVAPGAGLRSFETGTPVGGFDLLAFSVTFEPDYLNVLKMLRRAGLGLRPGQRGEGDPLLLLGGVAMAVNPEPLAEFADLVAVGDGEVTIGPLLDALRAESKKAKRLERLVGSPGFYHPALYRLETRDGRIVDFQHDAAAPARIRPVKADPAQGYPHRHSTVITPHTEFADTFLVELSNGCRWGCRFCWIGYNQLPPRNADHQELLELVRAHKHLTRRVGLVSASICDYPELYELLAGLEQEGCETTLAALRIDAVDDRFADAMARTGQRTPTLAPEAGSDRLRRAINKDFSAADIVASADKLFARGFPNMKLYFIIGIPTETERDVAEIAALVEAVRERMLHHGRQRGRLGTLSVRVSCFVPKPNIPLQWLPMDDPASLERKAALLRRRLGRMPNVRLTIYSPRSTEQQTALSMGGRELGRVLEVAVTHGALRRRAFREAGVELKHYVYRERERDERFPWDILDTGMSRPYLWQELQRLRQSHVTAPCPEVEGCHRCGIC